jgi:hypothetical protein
MGEADCKRVRHVVHFCGCTVPWLPLGPLCVALLAPSGCRLIPPGVTCCRLQVTDESRRSVLVDILTVYGEGGKAMVFTQTKREADEVAAAVGSHLLCEVRRGVVAGWLGGFGKSGGKGGREGMEGGFRAAHRRAQGLRLPASQAFFGRACGGGGVVPAECRTAGQSNAPPAVCSSCC